MEHLPTLGTPNIYVLMDDLIYVGPPCWYEFIETYKKYLAAGNSIQPAFVKKREDGKYDMFWGIQQFEVYKALGYTELPCYLSTDPANWPPNSIRPSWLFIPTRNIDLIKQGIRLSSNSEGLSNSLVVKILQTAIRGAEDMIFTFQSKIIELED